jgi:hypothetical protein
VTYEAVSQQLNNTATRSTWGLKEQWFPLEAENFSDEVAASVLAPDAVLGQQVSSVGEVSVDNVAQNMTDQDVHFLNTRCFF